MRRWIISKYRKGTDPLTDGEIVTMCYTLNEADEALKWLKQRYPRTQFILTDELGNAINDWTLRQ